MASGCQDRGLFGHDGSWGWLGRPFWEPMLEIPWRLALPCSFAGSREGNVNVGCDWL